MCDESLNNEKCNYDGGDCCALDSLKHPQFCGDCLCHKPELYAEIFPNCSLTELKSFRNGHCDESLLSFECGFDAGDCCDAENKFEYGNGICNRELNNGQCLFDGLDCCNIFAEQDPNECDDCLCEVPQLYAEAFKHCPLEELKKYHNGHCDGSLNNPQCGFDGGDCCDPGSIKDPDDCQDCQCKEDECPLPFLSFFELHNPLNDSYCNDDLNHEGCGFDGMDCCLSNPESKSICQDCQCKNPAYFLTTTITTTDFPIIIDIITTSPEIEFPWSEEEMENCISKNLHWIQDDYCDDELNNEGCHFDGGDCCLFTDESHEFCFDCECIAESIDHAPGNVTDLMELAQDLWNSTNEAISSLTDLLSPGGWPSPSAGGMTSTTPGPTTTPAPSPPMVSSGVSEANFTSYNASSIIKMLLTHVN